MSEKTIVEKVDQHKYNVPVYTVVDGQGIELVRDHFKGFPTHPPDNLYIQLVRGSKVNDENKEEKLDGVLVEQLLEVCKLFLEECNTTEFSCRENSLAIIAIEEAQLRLYQREYNRKKRNVLGTYKK